LRELANPKLHDIANLSHHVELWDRDGQHIRWLVAAAGTVAIGHAVKNPQSAPVQGDGECLS
jgi:hypothetical protein